MALSPPAHRPRRTPTPAAPVRTMALAHQVAAAVPSSPDAPRLIGYHHLHYQQETSRTRARRFRGYAVASATPGYAGDRRWSKCDTSPRYLTSVSPLRSASPGTRGDDPRRTARTRGLRQLSDSRDRRYSDKPASRAVTRCRQRPEEVRAVYSTACLPTAHAWFRSPQRSHAEGCRARSPGAPVTRRATAQLPAGKHAPGTAYPAAGPSRGGQDGTAGLQHDAAVLDFPAIQGVAGPPAAPDSKPGREPR